MQKDAKLMVQKERCKWNCSLTDWWWSTDEDFFPREKEKEWTSHRVFTSSLYDEEYELYSPSKKYILTQAELKKLKETYSAIYDLNINQIEVMYIKFIYRTINIIITHTYYLIL